MRTPVAQRDRGRGGGRDRRRRPRANRAPAAGGRTGTAARLVGSVVAAETVGEALSAALEGVCEATVWERGEGWVPTERGFELRASIGALAESPARSAAERDGAGPIGRAVESGDPSTSTIRREQRLRGDRELVEQILTAAPVAIGVVDLAESLGVSSATLHQHLRIGERKLPQAFFEGPAEE